MQQRMDDSNFLEAFNEFFLFNYSPYKSIFEFKSKGEYIDYLKNFGFAGETTVMATGINSKMNEVQAALGLLQLNHHNANIIKRAAIADRYNQSLKRVQGIRSPGC